MNVCKKMLIFDLVFATTLNFKIMNDIQNHSKGEIVMYQPDETIRLEVRVENDTVWLTQAQMAELFRTTPQNVTIHIKDIYEEEELSEGATCKQSLQVRKEGKRTVHHPAPAPHHPTAPVKVDKRHGITNHTLANNTPRHGHSNAGHFGRR